MTYSPYLTRIKGGRILFTNTSDENRVCHQPDRNNEWDRDRKRYHKQSTFYVPFPLLFFVVIYLPRWTSTHLPFIFSDSYLPSFRPRPL